MSAGTFEATHMKAVVLKDYDGTPRSLTVADLPVPSLRPGKVLIKLAATSIGPAVAFPGGPLYSGKWRGSLRGGGAETAVFLQINSGGSATLSLGNKGPETITNLALQGNALVGKSTGTIESADAIRDHATSLSLKLLGPDDRLAGRIFASAAVPGKLAILPYIVELRRASAGR